jgi:formate dehydrogenase iron-sulfur subunit
MYSILVDITKCTGCEKCVAACIKENNLNEDKADFDRAVSKDGLSDNRLLSILELDSGRFARKSCMHCLEPSCVSACLVGGITKSKEGPVVYDPDKCIGCRYCMLSCPFHIPRYEWGKTIPFMKKCGMCYERLKEGSLPACVEACPSNAITFGNRDELLKKAHQTIKSAGSKYINHVWGEKEFGGTSLLYISDVDLAELGFPKENHIAIPELTDPLIEKTPFIGSGVALSLIGINWIVRRRNKLAGKNNQENKDKSEEIKEN